MRLCLRVCVCVCVCVCAFVFARVRFCLRVSVSVYVCAFLFACLRLCCRTRDYQKLVDRRSTENHGFATTLAALRVKGNSGVILNNLSLIMY